MGWFEDAMRKVDKLPTEHRERRELCKDSLWTFAQTMNPQYCYGDIHKKIYKWMEEYTLYQASQSSNKLILLPRAHLKSHMVATWVAWMVVRHPEVSVLYLSATSELAETQLFAIKSIFESGPFQHFFPEYIHPQEGKREKWNNSKISVDHIGRGLAGTRDATIATAGLTTNTTGWHADIICSDDIVVPENAYTEGGRADVAKKASQFSSIRNNTGFSLAAGTRYHPSDIYASWKKQEQLVYDEDGDVIDKLPIWDVTEYAVEEDGVFLWPRTVSAAGKVYGFCRNSLSRIKAEYEDMVQFFAQYYNNPNDPGSARIRKDRFQYVDPKSIRFYNGVWTVKNKRVNVYASIDFAYTTKKTSDYTAIVVIGIDSDGFIYVLDIDRFKTDKIQVMYDHVFDLHQTWSFRKIRAETTAAQSIIAGDLKDRIRSAGMSLSIDEFRPGKKEGTKEERISSVLEPRYENLTIYHTKGGYTPVLEEELILARPAHDDLKDALASAIGIAVKPSSRRDRSTQKKVTYGKFGGVAFKRN